MKKIEILFTVALVFITLNSIGQKMERVELGLGLGTNSFKIKLYDPLNKYTTNYVRQKIDPRPVFRIGLQLKLLEKKKYDINIQPFLGYYTYGGSSKTANNGYKDKFNFNSIEVGIIPNVTLHKRLQIGIGIKEQYTIRVIQKSYGTIDKPVNYSTQWKVGIWANAFKVLASNLSFCLRYVKPKYTCGVEYWHGITNLNDIYPDEMKSVLKESNIRLLFTYNLKRIMKATKIEKPDQK